MANRTSVDITKTARENFSKILVDAKLIENDSVNYVVSNVARMTVNDAFFNTEADLTIPSTKQNMRLKWRRFTPTDLRLHAPAVTKEAVTKALEGEGFILTEFTTIFELDKNKVHLNANVDSLLYTGNFTMDIIVLSAENALEAVNPKTTKELVTTDDDVLKLYVEAKGNEYQALETPDTKAYTEVELVDAYTAARGTINWDEIKVGSK